MTALETLKTFDENSLPDLDTVVLGALEFLAEAELPKLDFSQYKKPLVVGSGNAAVVGRMLFANRPAVFADESIYRHILKQNPSIDVVVVVSASGSKHAVGIVTHAHSAGLPVHLITNTPGAPAAEKLPPESVHVFPKVREPYTYNTSTYLSMLLARGGRKPADINLFIREEIDPVLSYFLKGYDAFFLLVPGEFEDVRAMLRTKFDELFGSKVSGRAFTFEEAKHAKTVVPSDTECFISFGQENTAFGKREQRLHVPLPPDADPATVIAIGYYVIGHIQKQNEPYFKENIGRYVKEASELFGSAITQIVE